MFCEKSILQILFPRFHFLEKLACPQRSREHNLAVDMCFGFAYQSCSAQQTVTIGRHGLRDTADLHRTNVVLIIDNQSTKDLRLKEQKS